MNQLTLLHDYLAIVTNLFVPFKTTWLKNQFLVSMTLLPVAVYRLNMLRNRLFI